MRAHQPGTAGLLASRPDLRSRSADLWVAPLVFLAVLVGGLCDGAWFAWRDAELVALPRINGARIGARVSWRDDLAAVHPFIGRARVSTGTALIVDEIEDRPSRICSLVYPRSSCSWASICRTWRDGPVVPASVVARVLSRGALGGGGIGSEFPSLLADLGMLAVGWPVWAVFRVVARA